MHQGTPPGSEQRLTLGQTLSAVLTHRLIQRLGELRLDLHGGHGDAVDEQGQIQPVAVPGGVDELLDNPQPVLLIPAGQPRVLVIGRRHLQQAELLRTHHIDTVAQSIEGATAMLFLRGKLLGHPVQNPILPLDHRRLRAVLGHDPVVVVRVRLLQPPQKIRNEQGTVLVVTLIPLRG